MLEMKSFCVWQLCSMPCGFKSKQATQIDLWRRKSRKLMVMRGKEEKERIDFQNLVYTEFHFPITTWLDRKNHMSKNKSFLPVINCQLCCKGNPHKKFCSLSVNSFFKITGCLVQEGFCTYPFS